jgi:hypothetical protein
MSLLFWILIFLGLVFLFVLLKVVGRILKGLAAIVLIIIVFSGIIFFVVNSDYQSVKEQYPDSKNLFVFVNGEAITYAVNTTGFSLVNATDISNSQKGKLQQYLADGDLGAASQGYYKLIVISQNQYNKTYQELAPDFQQNSLKEVCLGLHDGYIVIWPESIFFKAVQFMPGFIIKLGLGIF